MKIHHFWLVLILAFVSCSHPSDQAYQLWSAQWAPLSQVEQMDDNQGYSEYFKTIHQFQKFFESKNPGFKATEPGFANNGKSGDTFILCAYKESSKSKIEGKNGSPFQVLWDSKVLLEQTSKLEAEGYKTEHYAFDRVWPWYNGSTPLRLQWTLKPFGYTAETLMLNWLNRDSSDTKSRIKTTVSEFLAETYGPESIEFRAFLARKADESTYQTLLAQLETSLIGLSGESRSKVIQSWFLDFQNRYADRFQTNLYVDITPDTLTTAYLEIQFWARDH